MNNNAVLLALISVLAVSGVYLFQSETNTEYGNNIDMKYFRQYQAWKSKYGMNYNGSEDEYRFKVFKKNSQIIEENNAKATQKNDVVLAMNSFGAWNLEEFKQMRLIHRQPTQKQQVVVNNTIAKSKNIDVDWKAKGAVYPTENQGNCGSCWAFSGVEALQGLNYIVNGELVQLSTQQLVSCIPAKYLDPGAKNGCGGSEPFYAFTYTNEQGIETWENYPYVSGEAGEVPACKHDKKDSVFYNDGPNNGYVLIESGDVEAIKVAIQKQPLTVEVAAGNVFFQFYRSGILKNESCGSALDHGILMYGIHDKEGEEPYYMVQNSWGPDRWGEGGYGKILITEGDGICGINKMVQYPTSSKYP